MENDALAIPAGSPVIITVGMLVPVKDHSTLLGAMALLVRSFPDAILLICGDGELRGHLEELAQHLRIAQNIRFAGFRDDVFKLLRRASVYVCSSVSEGLSLSILEAMAAGKPVVATNVGGNPEVVRDGETGVIGFSPESGGAGGENSVAAGRPVSRGAPWIKWETTSR